MAKAIFYDPKRKRWRLLRRIFDVLGVTITLVIIVFVVSILRGESLPNLLLPQPVRPYRALREKERRRPKPRPVRRSTRKASQIPLNSVEGIRAAYYVQWDAASYASLKEYVSQIDLLFPEWLHMLSADGKLQAVTAENHFFDVIHGSAVRAADDKVMRLLNQEKADTEVFPLVNNFNTLTRNWMGRELGQMLSSADARKNFRQQVALFLASDRYRGLCLDFEDVPTAAQPGYRALINELNGDLHGRGMKLYVNLPADDDDYDYGYIARHSDGIILMDYDEHSSTSGPGPVASQDFFTRNIQNVLKVVPRDKLIVAIGAYGYDWTAPVPAHGRKQPGLPGAVEDISIQTAWLHAQESEADVDFDGDSLNPHYAYEDEQNRRHDVWYLSAVTALNQMRAAQQIGVTTFALWRLGSEDRSLWAIWDIPGDPLAPGKLQDVPPGQDVDYESHGEILRITQRPTHGKRKVTVDSQTGLVTNEDFTDLPTPYQVEQYGASPKDLALTFDDGPDPKWTPLMLDALKRENIKATFFVIGIEAEQSHSLVQRMYDEGHELGNHTWSHPDISNISKRFMSWELNLPERWFSAYIGVHPLYFRPPYSIDQEPDTADQVRPLEITQSLGYITIGDKIDPNDWKENPRPSAEQIVQSIVTQLDENPITHERCDPHPCGNVILLHDGGGNRGETVRAIPMIARELRARGYNLVPVSALIHRTRADVMPPIPDSERWSARVNLLAFWMLGSVYYWFIPWVFRVGDVLMSARLLIIGLLAVLDRLIRHRRANGRVPHPGPGLTRVGDDGQPPYQPAVAILIPAYNEEKVIERTIRAALRSDYPSLRVICIDDGSSDNTLEVARDAFHREISEGRVLLLTQPNSGKAEALNHGLQHVHEPLFVGIDADTVIARGAVSQLVPNFADPKIGAIAGNAKVGNRVNLWTRWQALEYITSQNFERRALNILGAVSVVPGAIGCWRTAAVRDAGGFHVDTVAEDADLTMSLLQAGYRVEYEDRALAFTEAPINANGLMRQRFRWSFGILQAVWKHKAAFRRGGKLGWVALPNILIFQILLPLVSPFIDIMFAVGAISYAINRYFHPDSTNSSDFYRLVVYFLAFLIIDFLASAIAFLLERKEARQKEDLFLLSQVWLQRFAYRQLFSIVLFKTLKRAIDGRPFSWDKLERTSAPIPMARV